MEVRSIADNLRLMADMLDKDRTVETLADVCVGAQSVSRVLRENLTKRVAAEMVTPLPSPGEGAE